VFELALTASIALLALLTSAGTLAFLWTRGPQPSIAELEREVNALRLAHSDMVDKVEAWQRRDRQRRLRESHEVPDPSMAPPSNDPAEVKRQLRARIFGGGQ
jgi:hypothetical protein